MIKHIVLLKIKQDLSPAAIQSVFIAMDDLRNTIPEIIAFSWGPNNSPEGLNRDYNYGFTMEFKTLTDRDLYLSHPEHVRVATTIILPALTDGINSALVFDYSY
jgi:hypothetical protein